jgi:hypothetical protein
MLPFRVKKGLYDLTNYLLDPLVLLGLRISIKGTDY